MLGFFRFFAERKSPALKCDRVGHRYRKIRKKLYMTPEYFEENGGWGTFGVMVSGFITVTYCPRCHAVLETTEIQNSHSIHGASMPTAMADEMRRNGFVVVEEVNIS